MADSIAIHLKIAGWSELSPFISSIASKKEGLKKNGFILVKMIISFVFMSMTSGVWNMKI